MVIQSDIRHFIGSEICLKIIQNESLLGQFDGILGYNYGRLAIINQKRGLNSYFLIDLSKLTIQDDYWTLDLGYNPTIKVRTKKTP